MYHASGPGGDVSWFLLARFWTSDQNRGKHFLVHLVGDEYEAFPVFSIRQLASSRARAPPRSHDIHGVDADGIRYLVYRFLLFHDDFNVSRTLLSQNICEAIYLLPLDLPSYMKTSPAAVRAIALTRLTCHPQLYSNSFPAIYSKELCLDSSPGILSNDLHTCSFPLGFATFAVAPFAVHQLTLISAVSLLHIFNLVLPPLRVLFELVNRLCYFPYDSPPESPVVDYILGAHRLSYYRDLQVLAVRFMDLADSLVPQNLK